MKTIIAKVLLVIALVIYTGISDIAQASIEKANSITVVTKDTQETSQSTSTMLIDEIQKIKILISENETRFKVLMYQENPDMNALYQNVDESVILHRQLKKMRFQLIKNVISKI